ncbi:MAG: DEAD/DEAH box helicase [Magnetococcales bacterium]|nr:DEAD/DEAH box helicase [Magnetococcales bacterium]
MKFSELAIPEAVMLGIKACGFEECTPIQALTLPLTLAGRDVAGQAQTGTGKTAAFLIAALSRVLTSKGRGSPVPPSRAAPPPPESAAADPVAVLSDQGLRPPDGSAVASGCGAPRILIVAPTRELAVQIEQDARVLGGQTGLTIVAVYGGVDYEKQRLALTEGNVDLLIGTPGRLIDYLKQKAYRCDRVESLVIDEADRMFDMGFIADLRYLLRRLPPHGQRLSMLFSATLSYRAQELSYEYMDSPEVISTPMDVKTVQQVTQCLYHVEGKKKISLLVGLLRRDLAESESGEVGRIMIFTNTKRMGETLQAWLEANAILSGYLSGDVPQAKRLRVLQRFQAGELPVLIATDVAGRGLHIDGVTHVINYDLPENAEDYLHRIGRTARAGAKGDAISLVDEEGAYRLEDIERYCGKIFVAWAPDALMVELHRPVGWSPSRPPGRSAAGRTGGVGRNGAGGRSRPSVSATPIPAVAAVPESDAAKEGAAAGKKRRRRPKRVAAEATPVLS